MKIKDALRAIGSALARVLGESMKNCMFCQYINIDQGGCGSEWTGCWSGFVDCKKGHDLGNVSDRTVIEIENIGRFVSIAMECPNYKLHPDIINMLNKKPLDPESQEA